MALTARPSPGHTPIGVRDLLLDADGRLNALQQVAEALAIEALAVPVATERQLLVRVQGRDDLFRGHVLAVSEQVPDREQRHAGAAAVVLTSPGEFELLGVSADVSDPFGDLANSIRVVRQDLDALEVLYRR